MMADMKTLIGCLASLINVKQEAIRARASVIQHKMEATADSVLPHLEETIKDRAEDVLASADQQT
jgi:hypothetical protein